MICLFQEPVSSGKFLFQMMKSMSCMCGLMRLQITCRRLGMGLRIQKTMKSFGLLLYMSLEKIIFDFMLSIGLHSCLQLICLFQNEYMPMVGGPRMEKRFPNR